MAKETGQRPFIHLHHAAKDQQVSVETEGDTFYLTVEAAIQACKDHDERKHFGHQFNHLLDTLRKWIEQQKEDIAEAYVTLRDAGLLFLVVRKTKQFNQPLEDSLSDLDISIAQSEGFSLIKISVLALPDASADSIESFLDIRGSSLKYAE